MNENLSNIGTRRGVILLLFFVLFALIIAFSLFKIQIINYDMYKDYVFDQMTVETKVNPLRGNIYDSTGKIIATNKTVWVLYVCPKNIKDAEFVSKGLSEITDIDYDTILKKTKKRGYKYQVIYNSIDKETADKIREFINKYSLEEQIKLNASTKRYYPYSALASHTLGFVNADGVGIYGLEKVYNNILEGVNGKYITAQDAKSNDMPFQYEEYIEDENGYNITTTLDYYIQHQLELQLKNAYSPTLDTLFGIVILFKVLQPANAVLPILVTLSGISVFLHPKIKVLVSVSIIALQFSLESYFVLLLPTTIFSNESQPVNMLLILKLGEIN